MRVRVERRAGSAPVEVKSRLDLAKPTYCVCVGRKGSGKSVLAQRLFATFPGDKVCIDPTGDVGKAFPPDYFRTIPNGVKMSRLPIRDDEHGPVAFRLQPKRSSPTYEADMDQAIALALDLGRERGRVMLYVDEAGRVARRDRVLPHYSEVLEEGRHAHLFSLACMPRPVDIDPLVLAQADYVYIFDVPTPTDRQRLAGMIGVPTDELDELILNLPEHGYIRFDAHAARDSGLRLIVFPPLPRDLL